MKFLSWNNLFIASAMRLKLSLVLKVHCFKIIITFLQAPSSQVGYWLTSLLSAPWSF